MNGNITLHKKLGVNPRMTICVNCGGEGRDLLLLGNKNYKFDCPWCKKVTYGVGKVHMCPQCKCNALDGSVKELDSTERIPHGICQKCEEVFAEQKEIIEQGGIMFRCKKCGCEGAIRKNANTEAMISQVRIALKVPEGPCGIEFDTCEQHGNSESA